VARALQCPTCGTKTRLDGVTSETFECQNCGQVLKVPPAARGAARPSPIASDGPAPPPRRRAPSAPSPEPPRPSEPPRQTPPPRPPAPVVAAAGGTSALPPREAPPVARAGGRDGRAPARTKIPRDALPLGVRIGAWVLAVPVGLVIVGVPARILGYLTSQKLLDVFVKHTLGRFVPLLVIVVLWALATTILVEVFVEGGRWLMLRRRGSPGGAAGLDHAGPPPRVDPGTAPPTRVPPRQRRSAARARGS
jgi:hypothetical protein